MSPANLTITFMLLLAGMGIPVMAALNAGLGGKLDNPLAAVFVLSTVAMFASLALLTATGQPDWSDLHAASPLQLLGGIFFIFYLATITYGAPRIGLGNAVLLVLFGQIVCATLIDHFALLGALKHAITPTRLFGLAMMGIGIILARN